MRSGWANFFFGSSLWWGGAYEVQVKVVRGAYVLLVKFHLNQPTILQNFFRNKLPCWKNHPSTGFNFWCRTLERRRHRYFVDVFVFFATKITKAQGRDDYRNDCKLRWIDSHEMNRGITERSLENAWRIKLPREQKRFSASTSLKGQGNGNSVWKVPII